MWDRRRFWLEGDKRTLDLFKKYGIGAVVSGVVPGWFGGNGENAGTMSETNNKVTYIQAAESFIDHPAIVGIDIGDEPSSLDFPYYGEVSRLVSKLFPNKFPYLNIYPSYGMLANNDESQAEKELGTINYKEYLMSYCKNIDLDYLSFDHYVYSSNTDSF